MSREKLYVGLNSGTSMDGVDAALVEFPDGLPKILGTHRSAYPRGLAARLRAVVAGTSLSVGELARLDVEVGRVFATAAMDLLAAAGKPAAGIEALGCHGQTVYHGPGDQPPVTVQLGDPNTVAQITGIDTVADLRRRDLAAGGQGAPLAPALHAGVFRSNREDRAVLNLGGIGNLTLLPADLRQPVTGFDTGPGNCLLDAWIRECREQDFDREGRWASSGVVDAGLLEALVGDEYFHRPPPKSTGAETFHLRWLRRRAALDSLAAEDIQATLTELTAVTVSRAVQAALPATRRVLVCGGGARNDWLMGRLASHLTGARVEPTDRYGLAAEWVEAALFAWIARETLAGRPIDLTATTGAAHPHLFGSVFRA